MVGTLWIISAPSGAGKTSLSGALVKRMSNLCICVSHTTRAPRPGEQDGRDYHFIDHHTLQRMLAQQFFLEHAQVFGYHYGTCQATVARQIQAGQDVILDIDWQGARQVRAKMPQARSIFIFPPSLAALEQRLRQRGQDDDAVIERRMRQAQAEMAHYPEYDYCVVNTDFNTALADLESIVRARRLQREVQQATMATQLRDLVGQ